MKTEFAMKSTDALKPLAYALAALFAAAQQPSPSEFGACATADKK